MTFLQDQVKVQVQQDPQTKMMLNDFERSRNVIRSKCNCRWSTGSGCYSQSPLTWVWFAVKGNLKFGGMKDFTTLIIPGSNVYDNVHVLPSCSPYVSNMHDVIYVWPKLLLILQKPVKLFKQATIFFAASVVVIRYFKFFLVIILAFW